MTGHRNDEAPKTIPHSFGFRPGVDVDKLNQLADELEAEAAARLIARFQHSSSSALCRPDLSRA